MYSKRELMLDIQTIHTDFYTLTQLYDTNNIPGFIIKKQFSTNLTPQKTNINQIVKQALSQMTPHERNQFINKQIELWDWSS